MRVISIVGARPQFVKLAPMSTALLAQEIDHVIVHTGQHYDTQMSEALFDDLAIPRPDHNLAVGSGPHGSQTGAMLAKIETVLLEDPSQVILVYGDTNSTLAGALAASKLQRRVVHVEAGLRSFNRAMPEEINRVVTDHVSDLLLAPTRTAEGHLRREGLEDRTVCTGDLMIDICLRLGREKLARPPMPESLGPSDEFVLATIHRPENTDRPARLACILAALRTITVPVVLAAHPRLVRKAREYGLALSQGNVLNVEPFSYRGMVGALQHSQGLITDSGGLQKEAFALGIPCTTIRTETEWGETLGGGWNVLDPTLTHTSELANREVDNLPPRGTPFGDGKSAERMVTEIERRFS